MSDPTEKGVTLLNAKCQDFKKTEVINQIKISLGMGDTKMIRIS